MLTIKQFCEKHAPCGEGRKWALENCDTMQDVWDTAKPEWLIWIATREGVLTEKGLWLFIYWCARQMWHLLDDNQKNLAVVAEKYANDEATKKELDIAAAAWGGVAVAWTARDAAEVSEATVWVAREAAWTARAAGAAGAAGASGAKTAAEEKQAAYLREQYVPSFEEN